MSVDKTKLLKSAQYYIAAGKIQQAIAEYLEILKENQQDWNLMIQVGDLYLKINKTSEAIQQFQKVADHYYLDGLYPKAMAIYKRINKLDPNLIDVCIKLADIYLKQGLTMDAKSQLQVAAQHYLSKNETKDAIQSLKELLKIEPDNLRTRNELAKAFKDEGMIPQAAKEYIVISDELLRKNLPVESLTVLETAYKMDCCNATILRKLLAIYMEQNEKDKATALLEESLRSDPENPEVLALLAELYADKGDYLRSHQIIDQAILHTCNKEAFWIFKGDLYLKVGDINRAYAQFEPAIDRQLKRKDVNGATEVLQKILRLDNTFHPALKGLIEIYTALKQTTNLINTYNQLVDALISKNLYEEAATALKKLMELEPDNEHHQKKLDVVHSFLDQQAKKESTDPPAPVEAIPVALFAPWVTEKVTTEDPETLQKPEQKSEEEAELEPESKMETPASVSRTLKTSDEECDFVSDHVIDADVFIEYGLIDKAIQQLSMITHRYPNSIVAHQKLKKIYMDKGEQSKAVEECSVISKILRDQGDIHQAEDLLSEARQIDPNHPSLTSEAMLTDESKKMRSTPESDVLSEIERLAQSLIAMVSDKPEQAPEKN